MTDNDQNAPGSATAPPVDVPVPGMPVVPLAFTIVVPDLRNGVAEDIQQAAPKASVDRAYKWVSITGATAIDAVNMVEYYVRGTYAQLMAAAGADITEAMRTSLRRKAIVLGAIRSGATAGFRLTANDMNVAECTASGYRVEGGQIHGAAGNGTAGGKFAVASAMATLDRVDIEVISVLVYLGMAVPILQGISLVGTGHHYLPTTKNVFNGMKRQAMGLASEATKQWIEGMGESFDDLAFHKACHPISPPLKRRLAKDPMVAMRLQASGHGAAAVRLPALPSDAAIGKTAVALVLAAKPVIESMGHNARVSVGTQLIKDLEVAPEGRTEREAVDAIKAWAAAHVSTLAFCAGIVADVHDRVGTRKNSLLTAYSVEKIMSDHPSIVDRGRMYSKAANTKIRAELDSGIFPDPNVSM